MSELRQHLQKAKAQYGQLRYGGDLAAQMLGKATTVSPAGSRFAAWRERLAAAAAIAICAAGVSILLHRQTAIPQVPEDPDRTTVAQVIVPELVTVAPPDGGLAISMPSFSFSPSDYNATLDDQSSNTSEEESWTGTSG